ncbi:hypothetical protein RP726_10990 [Candidatus Methylospira mobilis]|uniref:anti-sigma factor family protein n=1 Tax=Candidatus Methylospira mobilis TaxID=1808979 RepID=UPI001884FB8A|nr:hypothetical protein [Candidatus Methylospira mobilis]WNV02998.1 hypothetical protein RP726_10990 [Candidatus Methylospira mobilis]
MLTCKEAGYLLSQGMDQRLTRMKRIELRIHLWLCSACSNFEKQLKFLRKAVNRLDDRHQSGHAGLSDEARERIKKTVRT